MKDFRLRKLKKEGLNLAPMSCRKKKQPPQFSILIDQFKSPLIYVLFFASLVTLFLRDFKDTAVILLAVFVNTILGFLQESKAQKALTALKNILTPKAKVLREGKLTEILARDLVVGDLVVLHTGEKIPADGRLLEAVEVAVVESILTGESVPVEKTPTHKKNEVFMGTTILTGHGKMEVIGVGLSTKIGEIAEMLSETKETETPLQKRLSDLARFLAGFGGWSLGREKFYRNVYHQRRLSCGCYPRRVSCGFNCHFGSGDAADFEKKSFGS